MHQSTNHNQEDWILIKDIIASNASITLYTKIKAYKIPTKLIPTGYYANGNQKYAKAIHKKYVIPLTQDLRLQENVEALASIIHNDPEHPNNTLNG